MRHRAVQLAEEGYRLKAAVVAVHVRHPLARRAVIVKIKHRRHGIDTQTVDVIFLRPEAGVGYQKALDLAPADVKTPRAPPRMLHAVGSLIFVKGLSIEFVKPVRILGKMRRHPVKYHADARLVH